MFRFVTTGHQSRHPLSWRRAAWLAGTALVSALAVGGAVTPAVATPIGTTNLSFGDILVGHSAPGQSSTLTNSNGTSQSVTSGGASAPFTGTAKTTPIAAGGHFSTPAYSFAPTSAGSTGEQVLSQTVTVTDNTNGANSSSFTLGGTAVAPIGAVSEADAGYVYIAAGHSGTATVTITDIGHGGLAAGTDSTSNAKYLHVTSVGGASGAFAGGGTSTSFALQDAQNRAFNYSFTPTTLGAQSAAISYAFSDGSANGTNAAVSGSITVHGTGVAPVASVNGSNVGDVLVGQNRNATVTVTNNGDGNLDTTLARSVTNLNGTVAPLSSGEFSGAGGAFSLNDGTSLGFTNTFTPTIRGAETQSVGVSLANGIGNGNASGTLNAQVTGQGVAPVQSVSVTGAGAVRIGAAGPATVTVQNVGDGNLSGQGDVSNLHGTAGGPTGGDAALFSGSGGSADLGDGGSKSFSYSYAPTLHAQNSTSVNLNFANGSSANTNAAQTVVGTLTGQGVGPVYQSVSAPASTISFGLVRPGLLTTEDLVISNVSSDPGGITLTGLTLLSGSRSGPQAGNFTLEPGTIGEVLSEGDSTTLAIDFTGLNNGLYTADLTILTDQDAAFGTPGDSFSYVLQATVVPEPSSLALLGAAIAGLVTRMRRRA